MSGSAASALATICCSLAMVCSSSSADAQTIREPSKTIVHAGLQTVVTEAKLISPQASAIMRSPPQSYDPWMVCVRGGKGESKQRIYSVFFTQEAYSKSALSSVTDGCDNARFSPFK